MANPYPWTVEKTFKHILRIRKTARNVAAPLALFTSLIFSPLALLVAGWAHISYRRVNDSYKIRGITMGVISVILGVLFYSGLHLNPVQGFMDVLNSFGSKKQVDLGGAFIKYLVNGFPISLFFASFATYFANGYLELVGKRYLYNSRPTVMEMWKVKKARKNFSEDKMNPDMFEVGVVKTDIIPWRQNRRGMVVGTEFRNLKHGYLIGANGTGKTIAAMNITAEYVEAGWSIVFPDFKGDRKTENMLAAIAREKGVPFYSFWSNNTDTGLNYDPLAGVTDISPASIIITAFDFTTEGAAKYYTDMAERYLSLIFMAKENGMTQPKEDESNFDWLLRLSDTDRFISELKMAAGGRDKEKAALAKSIMQEIAGIKDPKTVLSGLQSNLSKMVNTIGAKMRPSDHMIDFRKAAEERAIVYFGIPSSGDKIVMRALGALIIRDLVSFTSERQNIVGADVGNPVLVMPDEASQLQEKAEAMLEILQQGRSAKVLLFPAMQTFGSFTEKFIRELLGNSPTSVVLRVSDEVTAQRISDTMGTMVTRSERRDMRSETDAMGTERQVDSGGGAGTLMDGPRVPVDKITQLSNQTALVYFPESADKATVKKPRKKRVRDDETPRDIPTVYLFSRQFILDAENDTEVTREMLNRTLGRGDDLHAPIADIDGDPFADEPVAVEKPKPRTMAEIEADLFDQPDEPIAPQPGEPEDLSDAYDVAVDDDHLFDEPEPPEPVVMDDPVFDDNPVETVVEPEEVIVPVEAAVVEVPSEPIVDADDFADADDEVSEPEDGAVDEDDEWGVPAETDVHAVESAPEGVQRYQGASPESENSTPQPNRVPVKETEKKAVESDDDDGTW